MKLSVVIPTHQRHEGLVRLLDSIEQQVLCPSQFEVLIVSNLRDSFVEQLILQDSYQAMPFRVLVAGQRGVNIARNRGLKEAQGPVVLMLDDDCILLDKDYFSKILLKHEQYSAVMIGGSYRLPEHSSNIDKAYYCLAQEWQSLDFFGSYASERLVGGNVSYKREDLLSYGELFNEDIQFGGAELEFHHRLLKKGAEALLFPSLSVEHRTTLVERDLVEKAWKQAKTQSYFYLNDYSLESNRFNTYQRKSLILAQALSCQSKDVDEIQFWIQLYDFAYHCACQEPHISESRLRQRVREWGRYWGRESLCL